MAKMKLKTHSGAKKRFKLTTGFIHHTYHNTKNYQKY